MMTSKIEREHITSPTQGSSNGEREVGLSDVRLAGHHQYRPDRRALDGELKGNLRIRALDLSHSAAGPRQPLVGNHQGTFGQYRELSPRYVADVILRFREDCAHKGQVIVHTLDGTEDSRCI